MCGIWNLGLHLVLLYKVLLSTPKITRGRRCGSGVPNCTYVCALRGSWIRHLVVQCDRLCVWIGDSYLYCAGELTKSLICPGYAKETTVLSMFV